MNNQKPIPSVIAGLILAILSIFCMESLAESAAKCLEDKVDPLSSQVSEKQKQEQESLSGQLKWKIYTWDEGDVISAVVSRDTVYAGIRKHLFALDATNGQVKSEHFTGEIRMPLVMYDNILCVASWNGRYYVTGVDTRDANYNNWRSWTYILEHSLSLFPPLVASDGIVCLECNNGYVCALNIKTGQEKWQFGFPKPIDERCEQPTIADGVVYVKSVLYDSVKYGDQRQVYIHALDIQTGREKWKIHLESDPTSRVAVSNGIMYFGSSDTYLYAVNAMTGEKKWQFKTGEKITISPVVSEGTVYVGSWDNSFYAVDAETGQQKWRFETQGDIGPSAYIPILSDDIVYFGSQDGYFYAVHAKTGQQKWRFPGVNHLCSVAVSDNVIYVGSGGRLFAIYR